MVDQADSIFMDTNEEGVSEEKDIDFGELMGIILDLRRHSPSEDLGCSTKGPGTLEKLASTSSLATAGEVPMTASAPTPMPSPMPTLVAKNKEPDAKMASEDSRSSDDLDEFTELCASKTQVPPAAVLVLPPLPQSLVGWAPSAPALASLGSDGASVCTGVSGELGALVARLEALAESARAELRQELLGTPASAARSPFDAALALSETAASAAGSAAPQLPGQPFDLPCGGGGGADGAGAVHLGAEQRPAWPSMTGEGSSSFGTSVSSSSSSEVGAGGSSAAVVYNDLGLKALRDVLVGSLEVLGAVLEQRRLGPELRSLRPNLSSGGRCCSLGHR
mmetsp:Transcript_170388/g.541237  ORF Transcript_170388/g.541237 Transcript_170388/m.541237 type:complete len:336 (-) Transcript_170388:105-1112(-)